MLKFTETSEKTFKGRDVRTLHDGIPFDIGPFRITPYLADHSATDAYMYLIEFSGERPYRVLYSGDFRTHGRKVDSIGRIVEKCAGKVDLLLLEGTGLEHGNHEPKSENVLQSEFETLFSDTKGLVFVSFSSQNIDRIVTIHKACLATGRTLVIDSYISDILKAANVDGTLPVLERGARQECLVGDFTLGTNIQKDKCFRVEQVAQNRSKWVVVVRTGLLKSLEKRDVTPTPDDKWCWSLWKGYLKPDAAKVNPVQEWFEAANCPARHLHTSGHASKKALLEFAAAINPAKLLFVHRDENSSITDFPNVMPCDNGEVITLE